MLAALVAALLALASRRYGSALPLFVARYAGDTLWATMVYFAVGAVLPRASALWVAAVALAGSYAVEVSQLYHTPWLDDFRRTGFGGLLLGHGFLWTDVACYTVGVALGWICDVTTRGRGGSWKETHEALAD